MRYLIDTHTFIWFLKGSEDLSEGSRKIIENEKNEIFISIVSLWEISIKVALGKLKMRAPYETLISEVYKANIIIISIDFSHTVVQSKLPFFHKDPFDRLIASQALAENMHLESNDSAFDDYFIGSEVRRVW
ncbi:type II toxin-antitoxin system VapC family toxin [Dyadobacter sp. CY326]|uniref:type II toxin-antitoxin system VapC family toxin n=1 Tax=Dyadobacter sp. CY326 TaxID=2907300 RepID=UPI001F3E1E61|nr:type II toxin-antitoxin system VapC family toxin [Dyadobacter sp. CY326]MCE7064247.1 type II toxin-antitoxin system VapC family toxin [Dyadobacter sp. CY326]